jgi:hypothetical protein
MCCGARFRRPSRFNNVNTIKLYMENLCIAPIDEKKGR